jgi:predicted anti-sigma-YlaC factor YlaD
MSQMECKDVLEQLSNFIEGEIPPALLQQLEGHIQSCNNCRIVLDTTRKTIYLYHKHAADQKAPGETVEHLYQTLHLDDFLPGEAANG